MNTEEFYKFPKDLARATGYVCQQTGEMVKFTPSTKIVYAYMLSRNEFFKGRLKGKHFESQRVIAESCGMDEKACGKLLRKMMQHGLIEGEKRQPDKGGHQRYYYNAVNANPVLWTGFGEKKDVVKQKKEEKDVNGSDEPLPPLYVYDNVLLSEEDLEFSLTHEYEN